MDLFQASALLLTLAALFNYLNHRFLKIPPTIGIMVLGLLASLVVLGIGELVPSVHDMATGMLQAVDFNKALMNGMLGLLLFAGALHVNVGDLTAQKGVVAILATVGVTASTFLVGFGMYWLLGALDAEIPLMHCLLFGSLISPTDPIAVLGILKKVGAPRDIETKIAGESLFNDGVAVVIFLALLGAAGLTDDGHAVTAGSVTMLFVQEAFGGAGFGLLIGFIAYAMLRTVDDYQVEILLSLALVMGGYALAQALHLSGPIAMVVAGLLIGNRGRSLAMSDRTRANLDIFWEMVDEVLNAVLFVFIGILVMALPFQARNLWPALLAVPVVLLARFIAVGVPIGAIKLHRQLTPHAIKVLVWGGLRGGISVALALWLAELLGDDHQRSREIVLTATYAVVVFSIVVQGLTIGGLLRRLGLTEGPQDASEPAAPNPLR